MHLHFFRLMLICHFPQSSSSDVLSDISICHFYQSPLSVVFFHCILSFYYVTLSSAILTVFYQRRHIMSSAFVVFRSHSHLSSSLGILNLSFTILCHCILSLLCAILLSCAFVVFSWHSICQFAFAILLMKCCSIMFFCLPCSLSFSSVKVFCHVVLSCSSAIFF